MPGRRLSFLSMRAAHEEHVMPVTSRAYSVDELITSFVDCNSDLIAGRDAIDVHR